MAVTEAPSTGTEAMNPNRVNHISLLLLLLCITALFVVMVRYFIMTLLLAAMVSALLMPVYERLVLLFRGRRSLSAATTMTGMLFLIIFPLFLLLQNVARQAVNISRLAIPWIEQQLREPSTLDSQLQGMPFLPEFERYRGDLLIQAEAFVSRLGNALFEAISMATYSAINDLFLFFVFLYTVFFFLRDGSVLLKGIMSLLPMAPLNQQRLLDKFLSVTQATIKGILVIGILQGGLAGVALAVAGIESALFWGTVMSLLAFIPVFGPPLVWVPAVLYLAATGQYPQAAGVLLFCSLVVGQIDNLLRPVLIGRDTRMHELLIFFGTLGGIGLFGAAGVILGPVTAALLMTVWELYAETFGDYLAKGPGG